MDFGLEWVRQAPRGTFDLWFRCGCIAITDSDGEMPMRVTSAKYRGDDVGDPGWHDGPPCTWPQMLPMGNADRKRAGAMMVEMRWLDEGGCAEHNPSTRVH